MKAKRFKNKGKKKRFKCPCCGYYTLIGKTQMDIAWDICPVCFWENDVSEENPNVYSGANHMTLAEGRENFKNYFSCDAGENRFVRKPKTEELPENNA